MRKWHLMIFLFLLHIYSYGQGCTTLGQTPTSAFPICGTYVFQQHNVPICSNGMIPVPGCSGNTYTDKNPYWFQFTCYQAGTLGFVITPDNLGDDYDWQLFDITGHQPNDVFSDSSLFVAGNWSGTPGKTGASSLGSSNLQCLSQPNANATTYATMPNLKKDHQYLLLIAHSSDVQSGYDLSFEGGTASLIEPNMPTYLNVKSSCGGDKIFFKLSKQILCSSIAPDGSDFKIVPSTATIISASGYNCLTSFTTDSIIVVLNNPLPASSYTIFQLSGNDGNTLSDNCNNSVAVNYSKKFDISSQQILKASFDFQLNYGCKIDTVILKQTGQNIVNWSWSFDGLKKVGVQTDTSIYYTQFGTHTIGLIAQNNDCIDSANRIFNLINMPLKAAFSAPDFACPSDTISFIQNSIGHILDWEWDFNNGLKSSLQNPPSQEYPTSTNVKNYKISLTVTDSLGCLDSTNKNIQIAPTCYIAVPTAFTPNGDGLNDNLYPLNAYKATNLIFRVYNRYGEQIFESKDWTIKWDGTYKKNKQPSGTYIWTLEFTEPITGKRITQKGSTVLIR